MGQLVVAGIAMVRNEVDIIRTNVLHHFAMGLDWMLIVDNGSTDGTDKVLAEVAERDPRVRWSRDDSPYRQSKMLTKLARQAQADGAHWVIPIDADEFWYARPGSFRRVLSRTEAVGVRVQVVNFIQSRSQRESTPQGLLYMVARAATPAGPLEAVPELVQARKIAHVEGMHPPKWISRPTPEIEISAGNHFVSGIVGGIEDTDQIICLHAPLRSRARLEAKAAHGRRVEEAGHKPGESSHVRRFKQIQEEGRLDEEWAANSFQDGNLDVFGAKHPVVYDYTLRDLLVPYLARTPWGKTYARLTNRLRARR